MAVKKQGSNQNSFNRIPETGKPKKFARSQEGNLKKKIEPKYFKRHGKQFEENRFFNFPGKGKVLLKLH